MINFIVCEDNNMFRKKVLNYIDDYIDDMEQDGQIALQTITCKEVMEYTKQNSSNKNIYILDIDLNEDINGLQLAKKIREHDMFGYIIFITNHVELSLETFRYKIKALDYIVKNVCDIKGRLYEALDFALEELKRNEEVLDKKKLMIKSGSRDMYIPLGETICIETSSAEHRLILHTMNRRIEFYGTLKKTFEELDDNFCRIHRSCVINVRFIKEIINEKNDLHVTMANDGKYPISKKYLKELREYVRSNF